MTREHASDLACECRRPCWLAHYSILRQGCEQAGFALGRQRGYRTWARARSSTGQSIGLRIRGLGVQIPPGAPPSDRSESGLARRWIFNLLCYTPVGLNQRNWDQPERGGESR
jgi:hypothetical protein